MSSANDKLPGWWARYGSRFLRFLLALAVFGTITLPLAWNARAILDKDLKNFTTVNRTVTETSPQVASKVAEPSQRVEQPSRNDELTPTKTEKVEESATPRVYVYMLQLAAWSVVLAVSLWAIVALTSDQ